MRIYELLAKAYGEQGWWPVDMNYHSAEGSDPREEVVKSTVFQGSAPIVRTKTL